jgi:ribonuclease HI
MNDSASENEAMRWVARCDGSTVPNPGRMGWGAVITGPGGETHEVSESGGAAIGCNNEAELRAVMATLRELERLGARETTVYSDSSVVVAQLAVASGPAVRPIARLAALFDEGRALLDSFEAARVEWIPAHRNARADALARAALGLTAPRRVASPGRKKKRKGR